MERRSAHPFATALLRAVRRAFPAAARAGMRVTLFEWLGLDWTTRSGVRLRVASYPDWNIYNEIFVSGEYDRAIDIASDLAAGDGGPLQIVDLGANVGYFSLRAVDRLRARGVAEDGFAITAVEAHPGRAREFAARVLGENGLDGRVRLVEGLVGERGGTGLLYDDSLRPRENTRAVDVPYVDLARELAGVRRIDLLKCDVEGAELRVLESWPEVLRKTRVAVFELHADWCDTDRCRRLLAELGFDEHAVLRAGDPCSTYAVWRKR